MRKKNLKPIALVVTNSSYRRILDQLKDDLDTFFNSSSSQATVVFFEKIARNQITDTWAIDSSEGINRKRCYSGMDALNTAYYASKGPGEYTGD